MRINLPRVYLGKTEKGADAWFCVPEPGRANPYGICDLAHNAVGSVSASIKTRPPSRKASGAGGAPMGLTVYEGQTLLINAESKRQQRLLACGFWKMELQKFAGEIGLPVAVVPLPARRQQAEQDRAPFNSVSSHKTGAESHWSASR